MKFPKMLNRRTVLQNFCLVFLAGTIGHAAAQSNRFDILIFTQRWPQTVCYIWQDNSPSNTCALPKDDKWTIHGIWPSQYHTLGPHFCNKSLPFNENALRPIENELNDKWIDVEKGRKPYSFWKHEWDKHGTCAAVLEKFNSEVKYFKQGLSLLSRYNMRNILEKANIVPGRNYALTDLFRAIERVLGKRAMIMCVKRKGDHVSYVFEIRMCFDKTLMLVDCDNAYGYPTNCDHSESVTYPGEVLYHTVQV